MLLVRNVFRCKPGQAKALVARFKAALASMDRPERHRVMTDVAAGFWTVVVETEVEDLATWETLTRAFGESPAVQKAMDNYMDLVDGGYREILRIE